MLRGENIMTGLVPVVSFCKIMWLWVHLIYFCSLDQKFWYKKSFVLLDVSVISVTVHCRKNTWLVIFSVVGMTGKFRDYYIVDSGCGDVNGVHCGVDLPEQFPVDVMCSAHVCTLLSCLVRFFNDEDKFL